MKFGVVIFPGSNCDRDVYHVIKDVLKQPVEYIWHKDEKLDSYDCLVLPGGFSYGDYLRAGAIARFSPVMKAVERFAREGGLVLGICNGFQILLEAGLLPGAMLQNRDLHFICKYVNIRVESVNSPFSCACSEGQVLRIPIAHQEGQYYADEETLQGLIDNDQVIFRYCEADGRVTLRSNPNGALYNIAGICNQERNVLGIMPHPERCAEKLLGSSDGSLIFESVFSSSP